MAPGVEATYSRTSWSDDFTGGGATHVDLWKKDEAMRRIVKAFEDRAHALYGVQG